MAALDFPAAPADGQLFNAPNGVTYRWVAASGLWVAWGSGPTNAVVSSRRREPDQRAALVEQRARPNVHLLCRHQFLGVGAGCPSASLLAPPGLIADFGGLPHRAAGCSATARWKTDRPTRRCSPRSAPPTVRVMARRPSRCLIFAGVSQPDLTRPTCGLATDLPAASPTTPPCSARQAAKRHTCHVAEMPAHSHGYVDRSTATPSKAGQNANAADRRLQHGNSGPQGVWQHGGHRNGGSFISDPCRQARRTTSCSRRRS